MADIQMSKEALETMTEEQKSAILRLTENQHTIHVTKANPFDLPEGYLAFRSDHTPSKSAIYGGIAPNGDVST